jgi:AraC family transcriptional regulator
MGRSVTEGIRKTCVGAPSSNAEIEINVVDYPSGHWQPEHKHDRASLTLVLDGSIREFRHSETAEAHPLSVLLRPAGTAHADQYGPGGCRTLQIQFGTESDGMELAPCPVWHHRGGDVLTRFLMLASKLDSVAAVDVEHLACALLATLLKPIREPWVPARLKRVKEFIDDSDPAAAHSLCELASLAGYHPVHLTRLFKRHYGDTIREYQKCRRWKASAKLVRAKGRIADIAHALGYADEAHFCRDFRHYTGLYPAKYRRLAGALSRES